MIKNTWCHQGLVQGDTFYQLASVHWTEYHVLIKLSILQSDCISHRSQQAEHQTLSKHIDEWSHIACCSYIRFSFTVQTVCQLHQCTRSDRLFCPHCVRTFERVRIVLELVSDIYHTVALHRIYLLWSNKDLRTCPTYSLPCSFCAIIWGISVSSKWYIVCFVLAALHKMECERTSLGLGFHNGNDGGFPLNSPVLLYQVTTLQHLSHICWWWNEWLLFDMQDVNTWRATGDPWSLSGSRAEHVWVGQMVRATGRNVSILHSSFSMSTGCANVSLHSTTCFVDVTGYAYSRASREIAST